MQKEKLYHYTIKDRLLKILATGEIQRSPRDKKDLVGKERQVVWLTINSNWENTCFIKTPKEVIDQIGRVRITLNDKVKTIKAYEYKKYLHNWKNLVQTAIFVGSKAGDWRVCIKNISIDDIEEIHFFENNTWNKISEEEMSNLLQESKDITDFKNLTVTRKGNIFV